MKCFSTAGILVRFMSTITTTNISTCNYNKYIFFEGSSTPYQFSGEDMMIVHSSQDI